LQSQSTSSWVSGSLSIFQEPDQGSHGAEYIGSSDHYLAGAPTQRVFIMESIYMLRNFVTSF
jgi:hypothetical protein